MVGSSSSTDLRIVILGDNLVTNDLKPEHGFSLWIDMGGQCILFDTGQGPALASNALKLKIDCSRADHRVLSHGHYDHTGGLRHVLDQASEIHVHCHPGIIQQRFSIRLGASRPIKMPIASGNARNRS